MKKGKKAKVLLVVGVITLLLLVSGATFAYFTAQGGEGTQTNVNVTTGTTDSLVFEVGKPISITADQDTFAEGVGNREESTIARATLKANSGTNNAIANYYVYLNVLENTLIYTTEAKTAELILQIIDPDGNQVTEISDLKYVKVGDVSGFDITVTRGFIPIVSNHEITSTGTKIEEWEVKVILVNLDSDQNLNAGKIVNSKLVIQKEKVFTELSEVCEVGDSLGTCIKNLGDVNNFFGTNILKHDANLTNGANDGSYRYAGGDSFVITDEYKDQYTKIYKKTVDDTDALIGYMCGDNQSYVGATCDADTKYYYLTYDNTAEKAQFSSAIEARNQAISEGYIKRDFVNNFVCFGSDEEICPSDNLYRIIGVFGDKLKLIKFDYALDTLLGKDGAYVNGKTKNSYWYKGNNLTRNKYKWKKATPSDWTKSELNTINLNKNFLENIGEKWANKILVDDWYVKGAPIAQNGKRLIGSLVYKYEIEEYKVDQNPYEAKVGLMYASDYAYAATPNYWTYQTFKLSNSNDFDYSLASDDNWMYLGAQEWTITRNVNGLNVFIVMSNGACGINGAASLVNSQLQTVRPTFSISSSIIFNGEKGTQADPFRIA